MSVEQQRKEVKDERLLQMNRDYLTYIIKQLRESIALESAIGNEFTKTNENQRRTDSNYVSFLSQTLPESKIFMQTE